MVLLRAHCCVLHADKPFRRDACFVAEIWVHPALSCTYRSPFSDNAAVLNILFIEIKWAFFFFFHGIAGKDDVLATFCVSGWF